MDRHVRWLRRLVVPRIALRLTIEFVVVGDLLLVLFLVLDVDRVLALSWALLGGLLFGIARLVSALMINPVSYSFLRDFNDWEPSFVPTGLSATDADDNFLADHNLRPIQALHSGDMVVDLYASPDDLVLATTTPTSAIPTFVTLLSDGRILVTSNQLVLPHESVVVNHDRRRDARWLVEQHVQVLEKLYSYGISPVAASAGTVAQLQRIEHEAWAQMGPFIGPLLNVGTRIAPHLLTVRIPGPTILERTIERRHASLSRIDVPETTIEPVSESTPVDDQPVATEPEVDDTVVDFPQAA